MCTHIYECIKYEWSFIGWESRNVEWIKKLSPIFYKYCWKCQAHTFNTFIGPTQVCISVCCSAIFAGSWSLIVHDVASRDECGDDVEEDVHLTEMTQILEIYQLSHVVCLLPTELYNGQPKTTLESAHCCTELQCKLLYKYRHFLYITGKPVLVNCLSHH